MWLLKFETLSEIRAAQMLAAPATASQQTEFVAARARQSDGEAPAGLTIAGDTAQISVTGVLVSQPSFMMWLFGVQQTAYSEITEALSRVASDPSVKRVSLFVDSPGGQVDGLFETLAALQAFNKPMSVTAACACSAAYAIAATAGKITATNAAAEFGSIGVACSVAIDDSTIDIASTEAPNKRPDATTPEGKAVIVEYLDAIHELFADAIAQGRGTTVAAVNSGYGRGGTLLAGAAKSKGMIDGIAAQPKRGAMSSRSNASADPGPLTTQALELCEQGPNASRLLDVAGRMPVHGAPTPQRRAAYDLGDHVVAIMDSKRTGKTVDELLGVATEAPTSVEPDLGDKIVANMDARREGKTLPYQTQAPAMTIPEGKDFGDLVWEQMEAKGYGRKKVS
jgi:ClpP class serine protease